MKRLVSRDPHKLASLISRPWLLIMHVPDNTADRDAGTRGVTMQ